MKQIKLKCEAKDICSKLPNCFKKYFIYIKALEYEEEPDYQFLIYLFKKIIKNKSRNINNIELDW